MLQDPAAADATTGALRRSTANNNEEPVSDDEDAVLIDVASVPAANVATPAAPPKKSLVAKVLSMAPRAVKRRAARTGASKRSAASRRPSKVLFLDGVRGMASLFVVTEHSLYWNGKNLGACAVDVFFVLSSFLLTMLFYKKSAQLLEQRATYRKWFFTLADYFSKRFFRVYPLFFVVAVFVWLLPFEAQKRYFFVPSADSYDLFQVLTFELDHRFHVFWTLPLEIAYYFLIPAFVLCVHGLKRVWWVPFIPLTIWIVNAGLKGYREHHLPLAPHLPTFVVGSMGAVFYVKLDAWLQRSAFEFKTWHKVVVRVIEALLLALLLSVTFKGLLFHWVHPSPAPTTRGSQCVSMHVTALIVIEMVLPSALATLFEWNVLRYWGKISFSVYLLHSFVIYSPWLQSQHDPYDKFFAAFALIALLAHTSYCLIEYPSQCLSLRISKALSDRGGLAQHVNYLPVALTVPKDRRAEVLITGSAHKNDDERHDSDGNSEQSSETTARHGL